MEFSSLHYYLYAEMFTFVGSVSWGPRHDKSNNINIRWINNTEETELNSDLPN